MDQSNLDDLLECSVCLETLGLDHKVLPCQHTFCVPCLQDLANKGRKGTAPAGQLAPTLTGFLCPECRSVIETPLEKLPSNVILNRLLEGLSSKRTSQQLTKDQTNGHRPAQSLESSPRRQLPFTNGRNAPEVSRSSMQPRPTYVVPMAASTRSTQNLDKKLSLQNLSLEPAVSGNLSTNPFLPLISNSHSTPPAATIATASPTRSLSASNSSPESPLPSLPPKPSLNQAGVKLKTSPVLPSMPLPPHPPPLPPPAAAPKGRSSPPAPGPKATELKNKKPHQIYRALYDYEPIQADELALQKNELYSVIEKCQDGWFKGSSLTTLKTGVFPGNYVTHVNPTVDKKPVNSPNAGDLIDFGGDVFSANRSIVPPNVNVKDATKEEMFEAIEAFPASNDYELDLQRGDKILMVKQRSDGWCKGVHLRSKKTGLFPSSFVRKL